MSSFKKKIVITGGSGRFGRIFKKNSKNFKFSFFFLKKINSISYKLVQ